MVESLRVGIVGCGDLGTELGRRLVRSGHEVIGIRRHADKLPDSFSRISADVSSSNGFSRVPKELDIWVYALAADDRTEEAYRNAYEVGAKRLADHLNGSQSGRIIFVSSTSVYEFEDGREVTEETQISPQGMAGGTIWRGESVIIGLGGTSVRLGGIYGAGRHWLVNAVREGRAALKSGAPRYTNRIHRDDAVGLLSTLVLSADSTIPQIVLGVDEHCAPWNEVVAFLAEKLGVSLSSSGAERAPSGSRRATNKRCKSVVRQEVGYTFEYPSYREGYEQVLRNMGLWND